VWRQGQSWLITANYSLDWHLSEFSAYICSSMNIEKIAVSQNRINENQPSDPSRIRTLLEFTGELRTDDRKTLIQDRGTSQDDFDLITTILVDGRGETSQVDFRAQGHFASEQAHAVKNQFQPVLGLVSSSQDCRLRELKMLCDSDFARILEWNKDLPALVEECVDDIISSKARSNPFAEAIYASDGSMNYLDLITISDIVAQNLQVRGIGAGSIVPLYFEKSKWVVVGVLAVVKTGATFLLLDPSHPPKRLRYMAETVQANIVLCSKSQARTSVFEDSAVLVIDDLLKPLSSALGRLVDQPKSTPESDLYIMFTSGTTGRPKAFPIQHRAFCASATARAPLIKRDSKTRVLQFCAFSFDPCIEDILTTLMFGGCICIPSEHERLNNLDGFIRHARVNAANVTPGVIDLLEPDEVPSLKVLILSGEAMKKRHVDTWANELNLMNGYGPSECCIKCALNPSVTTGCDPKNIGKAVGSVLWIVDALRHERLAPIGAVGELVVEGPTLSRGYLNKDEAQKAFVKAPKWLAELRGDPTARLYRTGDLVKYNPDGSITFIGRRDTQVKIRGQRIELEEVEKTITESLPVGWRVVTEAVVFQGTDEPTLAAFLYKKHSTQDKAVISLSIFGEDQNTEFPSSVVDLVSNARKSLPSYMVPEAFIPIRGIPLTVHGKTDRAAIRLQVSKIRRPRTVTSA
jgi:amino acid adenylation domain-containing protein